MMIYSEVLAANFESGIWTIYDSKLLNLEHLEIKQDTSNATHILTNLYPRQPVDPDASMERNIWMDQNKEIVAQLVSAVETDHVKSMNQDKEVILDDQKPLILLTSNGVSASTNAHDAQVEWSLWCAGGCMNLILAAECLQCVSLDAHCSWFFSLAKGISHDPKHLSC